MISSSVKTLKVWLSCSAILAMLPLGSASANIAVQDLFIMENVRIPSGGQNVDLTSQLINGSMGSLGTPITLGGGVTFTPTNAFKSLALDADRIILDNTTVQPGLLRFENASLFSVLTSSDLSKKAETIGVSDHIQSDITSILPSDVEVGDVGRMDSSFIQFRTPADQSAEMGLTPLQIAESRASKGLISIPSIDGVHLAQITNLPFIVAEGSGVMRTSQKIGNAFDDALEGAQQGAQLGSSVGGHQGTLVGALLGALAAGIGSYAGAEFGNREGDMTPDKIPDSVIPSPLPAVPEPETYALMLAGLAVVYAMARRRLMLG